jgi:hypothetical protein
MVLDEKQGDIIRFRLPTGKKPTPIAEPSPFSLMHCFPAFITTLWYFVARYMDSPGGLADKIA